MIYQGTNIDKRFELEKTKSFMCTAICYRCRSSYFGRNLDLEYRYTEELIITPRNFRLKFNHLPSLEHHYAIIGIGSPMNGYPLYYDAINEYGLGMASLNFVGFCHTSDKKEEKINLATYEIICYILGCCKSTDEAINILKNTNLTNDRFSYKLPVAQIHFMLSDKRRSIVAEPLENGFRIYNNDAEIMTNDPPFEFHLSNLKKHFGDELNFNQDDYSKDIKAKAAHPYLPIPSDLSSESRFLRAFAVKSASVLKLSEPEAVNQFFHILSSVYHIEGQLKVGTNHKRTQYSSCANLDTLTYYCKTYSNSRIFSASLARENIMGQDLISYPLLWNEDIKELN